MKHIHSIAAALLCWLTVSITFAESPIQPGDHVAIVGNTFADQLRIHGYLETRLLQHTGKNPVSIRNLGWGGDMLMARDRPTGFPTEQSTLLAHKTDVIIACFGMGESFAGEKGVEQFTSQLEAFIASHAGKSYNGHSDVRMILVSPIACEDVGELTQARQKRNRELLAYTQAMRGVAIAADVTFVDLFETSRYLMDEPTGPKLTSNGMHLNPYGYWAISHAFCDQLMAGSDMPNRLSWLLRINATSKSPDARGVAVSMLTTDESGIQFQVTEESVPSLRPPSSQSLPSQLDFIRDTLIVKNLEPGKYQLTIDEVRVATANAEAWADGVPVDSSPAHIAAEAYRAVVNDKNLQFTYGWKALNQVHIVGERRSSPSGKELPKEVIEFDRLANELDKKLGRQIELKTRQWRIFRIGT